MPNAAPHRRLHAAAVAAVAAAVLAVVLALPSVAAAGCAGAGAHPSEASIRTIERATLCLVNKRRAKAGRARLRSNARLARAASGHSTAMVRHRFFSHTGRDGSSATDRIKATGYLRGARRWATGENIAWGSGGRATPRAIVAAWMRSSGHRANILRRSFRHLGVGVVRGAPVKGVSQAATYTTDFGRN